MVDEQQRDPRVVGAGGGAGVGDELIETLGLQAGELLGPTAVQLALLVEDGRVGYEQVSLALGDEFLAIHGWHDLATHEVELELELPPSWAGATTSVGGTWDELVVKED